MKSFLRWTLLLALTLGAPLALTGCQNSSNATAGETASQAIADAAAIVGALNNTVDQIVTAQPTLIPADLLPRIKTGLASAQNALAGLAANVDQQQAATVLKQVTSSVQSVLNSLSQVTAIPAPYSTAIQAADVLLPVVVAFVDTTLQTISPSVAAHRVGAPAQVMQARATLSVAAAGHH